MLRVRFPFIILSRTGDNATLLFLMENHINLVLDVSIIDHIIHNIISIWKPLPGMLVKRIFFTPVHLPDVASQETSNKLCFRLKFSK